MLVVGCNMKEMKEASHKIKILKVDYTDQNEGIVNFMTIAKNEYRAYFWADQFKEGEETEVTFDHLDFPLEWDIIFNENKDQQLRLVKASDDAAYLGYGRIKSVNPIIADFGDLKLDIGNWTQDERVIGEYIYWKIERLEVKRTAPNKMHS